MKIAKKLTVKEFGNLNVARLLAHTLESDKTGAVFFVGRIYGSVRAQEVVDTPHGTAIKFKGEFRGVGFDGEEVFSAVCYLPDPADQLLSGILSEVQGGDAAIKQNVEFAFDFFTAPDKGATGYKYVCKPLLDAAPSDPVAKLAAGLPPLQLARPESLQLADQSDKDQTVAGGEASPDAGTEKAGKAAAGKK